jgi:hypothetical protein
MNADMSQKAARQGVLLAYDVDGRQIVSIHAKETYAFDARGACVLAERQAPLYVPRAEPSAPWHTEMDVIPPKGTTDLIVHALAYGAGARTCVASIAVGTRKVVYAVSGDRRCSYAGRGSIRFSEPEPIDTLPICYENAYGGVDETTVVPEPKTLLDCFRRHPGAYPRNTAGKGYVVTERRETIDGLLLPNVEHPAQLLTPDNLVVGAPEIWWRQPLPWSCDWFSKAWYPRSSFLAGPSADVPFDDGELAEVRLGWVEAGQRARAQQASLDQLTDNRYFDAAAPALVMPFLRPGERIELAGMTSDGCRVVELPRACPHMKVHFEGATYDVWPVPNRVVISVEEERLSIVWHGRWRTPRELPDRLPVQGDNSTMELEGVEAFIDDALVLPEVAQ